MCSIPLLGFWLLVVSVTVSDVMTAEIRGAAAVPRAGLWADPSGGTDGVVGAWLEVGDGWVHDWNRSAELLLCLAPGARPVPCPSLW